MQTGTDVEYEQALRRAFVDNKWDSIAVWSRREQFQLEGIAYGERMGWLKSELIQIDEQSSKLEAELTEEGKKHFGIGG